MNETLIEQAKKLASRNYIVAVYEDKLSNGTTIYMAKNPELRGCMAQGKTIEDAINNLNEARVDYIYDSLEDGVSVPEPSQQPVPRLEKTTSTSDSGQVLITGSYAFEEVLEEVAQPSYRKQLYEAWIGT